MMKSDGIVEASRIRCSGAAIWVILISAIALLGSANAQEHATDFDRDIRWTKVQPPADDAPNARLKVFFDPVGETRSRHAEPYLPFDFYIVADGPHYGVLGWELKLSLDEGMEIISEELIGIRLGGPGEYIVGMRPDSCKVGARVTLAKVTAVVRAAGLRDLKIRLGPVEKSSLHDPPRPGYVVCLQEKSILPFDVEEVSAVVNPEKLILDKPKHPDLFKPVKGRSQR